MRAYCKCGHPEDSHGILDGSEAARKCDSGECPCAGFVDAAPCCSCAAIAGLVCPAHPPSCVALTQPTGRRAELIYELLSWINKAPIEQVEALAARTRAPGPMACIYIAGPFSGKDGWDIACNVHRAEELARVVASLGAMPMTPHSIGANMAGTESQTFWLAGTMEMMRRCDAVLFTDDWRRSAGARGENEEAVRIGLPVFVGAKGLGDLQCWIYERAAFGGARGKRDGGA